MKPTIEQVNAARKQLLEFNRDVIKQAIIVLGNDGFRLEVTTKPGSKWTAPTEFMGIRVVAL